MKDDNSRAKQRSKIICKHSVYTSVEAMTGRLVLDKKSDTSEEITKQ